MVWFLPGYGRLRTDGLVERAERLVIPRRGAMPWLVPGHDPWWEFVWPAPIMVSRWSHWPQRPAGGATWRDDESGAWFRSPPRTVGYPAGRRRRISQDQARRKGQARAMYVSGKGPTAIYIALGVAPSTLYYWIDSEGWQRQEA